MIYITKSIHIAKNGHSHQAWKIADSGPFTRARGPKSTSSSKEIFLFTIQYYGHGSNDRSSADNINDRIFRINDENIAIVSMTADLYTFQNALANLNA